MSNHSPVIIIGMHRSGTTLVTSLLEQLGLFVGWRKDPNGEALLFHGINSWIYRQSGGSWDHPLPVLELLDNPEVRSLVTDYIRCLMKTPRSFSYLGLFKHLRYGSPSNIATAWGWKDPQNTFTLPIWLDIFPESRIIHVCRHGVDVTNSLKVRQEKTLGRMKGRYEKAKWFYWIRPKKGGFVDTVRCASLEGGLSLWEEYLTEARHHMKTVGQRAIEVKYEDLLAQPCQYLTSLAAFCNLNASEGSIKEAARQVELGRAYAYRADPTLCRFSHSAAERLVGHGYEA